MNMQSISTAYICIDYIDVVYIGDIELYDYFEENIPMFGFNKVGKSSSCDYLNNLNLLSKGGQNVGNLRDEMATKIYPTAKI
jgi:hypothetical protein